MTEANRAKINEVVKNMSLLYLTVIGQRVDALSVSSLLTAWQELGMYEMVQGEPF